MRVRILEGLTIKAALFLGFGLTLSLWLLAGYDVARMMSDVENEVGGISARYTEAQELPRDSRPARTEGGANRQFRRRPSARTRSRFATLAQASSRTMPIAPIRTQSVRLTLPTTSA